MDSTTSSESSNTPLILVLILVILLALGGAGAWWFYMIKNTTCTKPSDCNDSTKPYCFSGKCTDKCVADSDCGATTANTGIHCGADGKCTAPAAVSVPSTTPSTKYDSVSGNFSIPRTSYTCPAASGINSSPLFKNYCVFNNTSDAEKWCDSDPACIGFVATSLPTDSNGGWTHVAIAIKEFPYLDNHSVSLPSTFYKKPGAIGKVLAAGTDGAPCNINSDCTGGNSCMLMPGNVFKTCKPVGTVGGVSSCLLNSDCPVGAECMLMPDPEGFVCKPAGTVGKRCSSQSACTNVGQVCMKLPSSATYATCQYAGTPGGVLWP